MDAACTLKRVRDAVPLKPLLEFHSLGHVEEYIRFLTLKLLSEDFDTLPPKLSPSHPVDAVWHTHMLLPHTYARTCQMLFPGRDAVFKHSPVPRADPRRYTKTLKIYEDVFGIKPNSVAWPDEAPSPAPSNEIEIYVNTMVGKVFSLHLAPEATVEDVKIKLKRMLDLPINQQRIIYAGRQLEGDRTLRDYRISSQSTLHVIMRLSGC